MKIFTIALILYPFVNILILAILMRICSKDAGKSPREVAKSINGVTILSQSEKDEVNKKYKKVCTYR